MSPPLLEARGIVKRHGRVRALRGVDVALGRGECVAILGPNGAGKSTLLRVLSGLARPDGGEVLVEGRPAAADPAGLRRRIGHVSHHLMLHDALTARENLTFAGRLHGVASLRSRMDQVLRSLGIQDRADEPIRALSRGLQQRAAVARALLHDPDVLLLDEPFTGLDRSSQAALAGVLASARRRGRALALVTHDLARAAELATRVVILRSGRVVHDAAGAVTLDEANALLAAAEEPS